MTCGVHYLASFIRLLSMLGIPLVDCDLNTSTLLQAHTQAVMVMTFVLYILCHMLLLMFTIAMLVSGSL